MAEPAGFPSTTTTPHPTYQPPVAEPGVWAVVCDYAAPVRWNAWPDAVYPRCEFPTGTPPFAEEGRRLAASRSSRSRAEQTGLFFAFFEDEKLR